MGIHNEPGHAHVSPIPPLDQLVTSLLDLITSTMDPERSFLPFGAPGSGNDEVVLLVNNLGGLSELEMGGIAREAVNQLSGRAIKVQRMLVGSFMVSQVFLQSTLHLLRVAQTSLNMPGFSLTLLLLPRFGETAPCQGPVILSLLDDTPNTPGWKWCSKGPPPGLTSSLTSLPETGSASKSEGRTLAAPDPTGFVEAIQRAAEAIIQNEPELTRLDNITGDGDAGLTHKSGAEHILHTMQNGGVNGEDVIGSITNIARVIGDSMDGTSGALYSIFFSALAQGLYDSTSNGTSLTLGVWTEALQTAVSKLFTYTRARPPSRTLVDPLVAFVQGLEDSGDFNSAVTQAAQAAEKTKTLEASAGRATYVEKEKVKGSMDPGALGVKVILEALVR